MLTLLNKIVNPHSKNNKIILKKYRSYLFDKFYYIKGTDILHREDGPALEYADGNKLWYQHGKLHRLDGPAIERADGTKSWYQDNKPHRLDGPAIECVNGDKFWYLDGKKIDCTSQQEFEKLLKLKAFW